MGTRLLYGGLAIIAVGFIATAIVLRRADPPRPGVSQVDHGGGHLTSKEYGGSAPPTSGKHANTTSWGIHNTEVADVNVLHNLEHGGIYISYRPDLPSDEIKKIDQLFSIPSSRSNFNPAKAVVAPRAADKANIIVSSWNRSETFTSFDENAMYTYYVANIGKSPEPFAN
jgi:hypothetical protein